ncbi:MAG: tetratricopeptide repeat protein [Chloroflexi bacterium]|nr:tetratricopeptide repeat protein [Chloroflexota bacterium]
MERPSAYIPMDRRQAIVRNETLPDQTHGAALFADISGFTPLTERLLQELGPQRGAEELTRHLNAVYDALIAELHRFRGSVISFSGDAITCWFNGDDGLRGTTCALAMQQVMEQFTAVSTPSGSAVELAMKTAVAAGPARRFLIGNPDIQQIDVLAGATLERLAAAEHQAKKGEVILDPTAVANLGANVEIVEWIDLFGVAGSLTRQAETAPWPVFPPGTFTPALSRPWLLPAIYGRLHSGRGAFLAELRPAVALFLRFSGIEYDADPEAGDKLDQFARGVQEILARYESNLLQLTIGDKGSSLYAAFGAPLAHEDDAIRAVSAALELRQFTDTLDFIHNIQIGISQGRLRTGAYGGTMRRTYGVLGDEVNLAARLMQAAAPNQILVSAAVHHGTNGVFAWHTHPPLYVKGKADPVAVFSVAGRQKQQTIRLQEPQYSLPIVGRQAELALLADKLDQVLQGEGQIVAITGEAGVGKSRLVSEIIRMASERQFVGFGGECQSYGTHSSYLVWQRIWQGFFGLDGEQSLGAQSLDGQIQTIAAQLEKIDPALTPRLPLLGAVLNLSIPDNDLTRSFDAKLRKISLESLLVDCLRARADDGPILFILDDCHWLDPLSQELIETIGNAITDRPVLLIMAARPVGVKNIHETLKVTQLPHAAEIRLSEFTPDEAERLISLKLNRFSDKQDELPPELAQRIIERAEGNPFYIEELLNYLQDRGIDPHDEQALDQLELPTSLHSLILSRIDQLTESQQSAIKVASVIGRLFQAAMLWGVYPELGDERQVKVDLDVLSQLDLTPLDTPEPELAYLFKNIVTQEVAYESLPYATRAMLHNLIGEYIERTYADTLEQYVNLLAHHYERSENEDKKREYLLKAGEAAQANYANDAALDYYERALPLLPPGEQAAVTLKLGQVLELVGQWDAAFERYQAALDTAVSLNDRQAQAQCQTIIGELHRKQGGFDEALSWLQNAQEGFEALGDIAGVGQALHYAGSLAAQQGDFETARERYEKSLMIRRQLDDKPQTASLLSNLGIVARYQGDYAAARFLHEEGLEIRRELGDRRAIAVSLNNLGNVALDQDHFDEARAWLEEAVALQKEVGDKSYIANSLNNLGNVVRAQKAYEAACPLYQESLEISYELGDKWALAYLLEDMGGMAAARERPQRALYLVGAAAKLREEIGAPLSAVEETKLEQMLAPARQALDETQQTQIRDGGYAASLAEVVEHAMRVN